jgi:hypothetical protein
MTMQPRSTAEIISEGVARNASPALKREIALRDRMVVATAVIDLAVTIFPVGRVELLGPRRTSRVVRPRFAVAACVTEVCGLSTTEAGQLLNRDHTTIVSSLQRHADLMQIDSDYIGRYLTLRAAAAGVKERQTGETSAFVEIERRRLLTNLQGAIAAYSIVDPLLAQQLERFLRQGMASPAANPGDQPGPSTRQPH